MPCLKQIFSKEKFVQNGSVIKRWKICGKTVLSQERLREGTQVCFCGKVFYIKHHLKTKFIWKCSAYQKTINRFLSDSKAKKIVLLSHNLTVTGAPLALYKIALILRNCGWKVLFVSPRGGHLSEILKENEIDYLIVPHILQAKFSVYQRLFSKFDAAICNTYVGTYAATCLQKFIPTLLYIHEAKDGLINLSNNAEHFLSGLPVTTLLGELNNVACVSDFAASFYQPYVKKPINIIHNFVKDTNLPRYCNKSSFLKIGYVGAIDDTIKKTDILCKAFADLEKKYPQTELHIIGNTSSVCAQKLIKQYDDKIVWHGEQVGESKDKLFNEMDIIVVPSLSESCSLVALEAAAFAKPIVITENVGAKYMFEHNVSAMIAKVNDVDSLSDCLETLVIDENLRDKLVANARVAYEKFATKENTQKELLSVLEKTITEF